MIFVGILMSLRSLFSNEHLLELITGYLSNRQKLSLFLAIAFYLPRSYLTDQDKVYSIVSQRYSAKIEYKFIEDVDHTSLVWKFYTYNNNQSQLKFYTSGEIKNLENYVLNEKKKEKIELDDKHNLQRYNNRTRSYVFTPYRFCSYRLKLMGFDDCENYRQFISDLRRFYHNRA